MIRIKNNVNRVYSLIHLNIQSKILFTFHHLNTELIALNALMPNLIKLTIDN